MRKGFMLFLCLTAITLMGAKPKSDDEISLNEYAFFWEEKVQEPTREELFKKALEQQILINEEKAEAIRAAKAAIPIYDARITTYGVDCVGCNLEGTTGYSALGLTLDMDKGVVQNDGTFKAGIQLGEYYLVAADASIPMCSIIEFSSHALEGSGITLNQPFKALVVDRGGGIQGYHFDLYIGSQVSGQMKSHSQFAQARIIGQLNRINNSCEL